MDLSHKHPEKMYPHFNYFTEMLKSKYRILTWNAMAIIANLANVDEDGKFEQIFDQYFGFLNSEYMVSVANIVGNSVKIAKSKPKLVQRITAELLKVEDIKLTPHLTAECKRVIIEKTLKVFGEIFDKIEAKEQVIAFAKRQLGSSRTSLNGEAKKFLKKVNYG